MKTNEIVYKKAGETVECIHKNLVFTEVEPDFMDELIEDLDDAGIKYSIAELPLGGKALYVAMDDPKNNELIEKAGWGQNNLKEWLWDQLEDANIYQMKVKLDSEGNIIEYFRGIP